MVLLVPIQPNTPSPSELKLESGRVIRYVAPPNANPNSHAGQDDVPSVIGFTTGLPAVYAYENGASEVALHCQSKPVLDLYCKPTLKRNNIPANKCKFSYGNLDDLLKALGGKKFDIILAPDLLNRSESDYEQLHDIINEAMAEGGICLFSSYTYYSSSDGSLDSFLSLVRAHRQFDSIERWSSPKTDIVQRKVYQLTRSFI
ncbi:hypothetical protein WR25_21705 [Diploscapter pachys]|uniref:Methyltransferase type 11 domain-containing protein n=1 Tax=Diploscapter pachys TaxID=2018661 RepID=A0A2A2LCP7_9BILA|nr:hypothetical protein WR25_21705 [Diploscapter pachys]